MISRVVEMETFLRESSRCHPHPITRWTLSSALESFFFMWYFIQQKWLCSEGSSPGIDYSNVLCRKVMKETETSMMKTTGTKTQCAMKQRETRLLSPIFGNKKKWEKSFEFTFFSLHFLKITGYLVKYEWYYAIYNR